MSPSGVGRPFTETIRSPVRIPAVAAGDCTCFAATVNVGSTAWMRFVAGPSETMKTTQKSRAATMKLAPGPATITAIRRQVAARQ